MFKTTQIFLLFLICLSVFSSRLSSSLLEGKKDNIHHISISNVDFTHPTSRVHKISLYEIVLLKIEQIYGQIFIQLVNHEGFTLLNKEIIKSDKMDVQYYTLDPIQPGRYTLKIRRINVDIEYDIEVSA